MYVHTSVVWCLIQVTDTETEEWQTERTERGRIQWEKVCKLLIVYMWCKYACIYSSLMLYTRGICVLCRKVGHTSWQYVHIHWPDSVHPHIEQRRCHRNEQDREHRQDHSIGERYLCLHSNTCTLGTIGTQIVRIYASRSAHQSPKDQYLYGSVWATPGHELHKQPWVEAAMDNFHAKQSNWEHRLCIVCYELWPTRCVLDTVKTPTNARGANVIRESPNCIH